MKPLGPVPDPPPWLTALAEAVDQAEADQANDQAVANVLRYTDMTLVDPDQIARVRAIQSDARRLAATIFEECNDGRLKSKALGAVEEALMFGARAVAIDDE